MRVRLFATFSVLALAAVTPAAGQTGPQLPGWLAGCWELKSGNRTSRERWTSPASLPAGFMLGTSRTAVDGSLREQEQMVLKIQGKHLAYIARPTGQAETTFLSTAVSDSGFTVENLQHDFPQRIIYRRRGVDSLLARIEGPGATGTRGVDYPMQRVSCGLQVPG